VSGLERLRYSARRLTNDFNLPLNGRSEEQIAFVLLEGATGYELNHRTRRGEHVKQPSLIPDGIVTRHK
jgi:hypothetical protein